MQHSPPSPFWQNFSHIATYLLKPVRTVRSWRGNNLGPDVMAGITVGLIALPQAVAFALIADLPPQMGLYATIVAAIVGGLWGSCNQIQTGPANAISILVFAVLIPIASPDTPEYLVMAGMIAVLAGVFQLLIGFARLGVLVNFVSHSVIVGFASGAAVLIAANQLKHLLGLQFESEGLLSTLQGVLFHLPETHWPTAFLGMGTIGLLLLLGKLAPKWPGPLMVMIAASFTVFLFDLNEQGVSVIGQLPRSLPPLVKLPLFNLDMILQLITGALAVGAIGLIQTTAIARSIAGDTGQRIDNNQEFVGQGMANVAAGFFSGYAGAASFARSGVSEKAGAQTSLAAVTAGLMVLVAMLALAPLGIYLSRTVLAGILIVVAYGLIKWAEVRRILRGAPGDAFIMLITFFGTLFVSMIFAIMAGIMFSFAFYLLRASTPRIYRVLPDETFTHFIRKKPTQNACPQLEIFTIAGDLYFGAVSTVEDTILNHLIDYPEQRFVLLRLEGVNNCDFSGIQILRTIRQACLKRGGDLYLMKVQKSLYPVMQSTGFFQELGADHFMEEEVAIPLLFHRVIEPVICIYECPFRAFKECQNLPKQIYPDLFDPGPHPTEDIPSITPRDLWSLINCDAPPPLIIDIRHPREFRRGHIPHAQLKPLPALAATIQTYSPDTPLILVCHGGARSRRVVQSLIWQGYDNAVMLKGGMLAWQKAGLPQTIESETGHPTKSAYHFTT